MAQQALSEQRQNAARSYGIEQNSWSFGEQSECQEVRFGGGGSGQACPGALFCPRRESGAVPGFPGIGAKPYQVRIVEIVFGSYFGTAPGQIREQLAALLESVNSELDQLLASLEQSSEHELLTEVIRLGCVLHVGLIRIHPFFDGNGRLARLAQLWLHTVFDYAGPIFPARTPYTSALGKALKPESDLELLITLTWAGMLL
jgi:Fic/DOC family